MKNTLQCMEASLINIFLAVPILRSILRYQGRLKLFVFIAVAAIGFISFNTAYLITSSIYRDHYKSGALQMSETIACNIQLSLSSLMLTEGKSDRIKDFLTSLSRSQDAFHYDVKIYRSALVRDLYGKTRDLTTDVNVSKVLSTGKDMTLLEGAIIKKYNPVRAEKACLRCHNNAVEGSLLGVVSVQFDLTSLINKTEKKIAWIFFLLLPIPLLLIGLVISLLNAKIALAIENFKGKIESISNIKDLTALEMTTAEVGFKEFNALVEELNLFSKRIKDVAVDKEMLEFQIKILERFIITSEVVRDWKDHVMSLLIEINKVVKAYALFSIFQVDDELYDIEVFWYIMPAESSISRFEHIIRTQAVKKHGGIKSTDMKIVHNFAFPNEEPVDLDEKDIWLQTKSLILEKPQVGGVVGIGVQADISEDKIRSLIIDGVLTTLINVVGSIKAIYKYTKDLEYYATRDPLTNLYNKRIFWELLGYEINRAKRNQYKFSVLIVDMDNFKNINDTYGHAFGDKYLRSVADTIATAIRQGDILGRYGGDEFSLVLPGADEEQAYTVSLRIKESIDAFSIKAPDDSRVKATVSIGYAVYPIHASEPKDLFLFADAMMYKAKVRGKNTVVVPSDLDVSEIFKKTSEMMLTVIKTVDDQSVIPYFQPLISLSDSSLMGYEVYGRIEHKGVLYNAKDFVETAEKTGLIGRLDETLIEKTFSRLGNAGYKGFIFINISPKSLIIKEYVPLILRFAAEHKIDKKRIVFEISEFETIKNASLLDKFINAVKIEGMLFALDDFGSGFSSLQFLRRLPVDFIKLSGDICKSMLHSDFDKSFVRSVVMFAKAQSIGVGAKSIEDSEALQTAKDIGIDFAQGYFVGDPSPDLRS